MTEHTMLKKEDFINFILEGPKSVRSEDVNKGKAALPEGFEEFGFEADTKSIAPVDTQATFTQRLLEAANFGYPDSVQTKDLIRSMDAVAKYLPDRASYWPKISTRPYQTLLFEANITHKDLLGIPAFKSRKMSHLDIVEDALARMVSEALEGFQKGGEGVTADVRKGKKDETLCIISILDERDQEPVRLVCFGTQNAKTGGLETFHITEQTRFWDQPLAKDHLGLLYERQFKKLAGSAWQEAFTTTEERKQAEKLLEVCSKRTPAEKDIQEHVLNLLDTIAKGFGLRCKPGQPRRLQAFSLPSDHDIGIDPEEMTAKHGGKNPFGGVTLRDERNRLLGYIVYPLKAKKDAETLRSYLEKNNRFHNVLVVFPDGDETTLELWQGKDPLVGKLRKDKGFEGAAEVVNLLSRFFIVSKANVRNPDELAQELAYRARYLRRLVLKELEAEKKEGTLRDLYNAFKAALVHDQTEDEFADAFAQTITSGMLNARWIGNDRLKTEGKRFTRQNALMCLPTTNPFLHDLFHSILGVKMDNQMGRFLWLVEDIADLLDRVDVVYVFGIGDSSGDAASDPVIHFYEPFLEAYDKQLKRQRGVFYTPQPVVSYIIRSVHELLQTEFGLEDGLASTINWGEMIKIHPDMKLPIKTPKNPSKQGSKDILISSESPFVMILDIATGTGTFIVEVIDVIHKTMKSKWQNQGKREQEIVTLWNEYVPKHLLPRLYGYELMMAPYAIAHMKIGLKLSETGYKFMSDERVRVYLTNTLEPASDAQYELVGILPALAHEAEAVNEVKRNVRFTVLVGNPPYSTLSQNMGEWIRNLVGVFRVIDGEKIQEKGKRNHLQDDYVKFMRIGLWLIQNSGCGVYGLITNHGFLYSPTFRAMRYFIQNLVSGGRFLDLNGNAKRDDAKSHPGDENVFDIQQGVSISILWIKGRHNTSNCLDHASMFGGRDTKYRLLKAGNGNIQFQALAPRPEFYFFETVCEGGRPPEYDIWLKLNELMPYGGTGVKTNRDDFVIDFEDKPLLERMSMFRDSSILDTEVQRILQLKENYTWKIPNARRLFRADENHNRLRDIDYRPFDRRRIYYQKNVVYNPRFDTMAQAGHDNIYLLSCRQQYETGFRHALVTREIFECCLVSAKSREITSGFPLYLQRVDTHNADLFQRQERHMNFSDKCLVAIRNCLGVSVVDQEQTNKSDEVTGVDLFAYFYAVLHSPAYRNRYAESLKIDFPRIPLTTSLELFHSLAKLGGELLALHLLESPKVNDFITSFAGKGDNSIPKKPTWKDNAVWINSTQRFEGVSESVWNFHIGGYQVCEKWLKDRKSRILSTDDIAHYQKIIVALSETIRIMKEIDAVIDKHGGWPGAFQSGKKGDE